MTKQVIKFVRQDSVLTKAFKRDTHSHMRQVSKMIFCFVCVALLSCQQKNTAQEQGSKDSFNQMKSDVQGFKVEVYERQLKSMQKSLDHIQKKVDANAQILSGNSAHQEVKPKAVACPEAVFSQEPLEFDAEESTLSCVLSFDDVDLCADIVWLPVKEGEKSNMNRAGCIYFWSSQAPLNPPPLKDVDYGLKVDFSMPETDVDVMDHPGFSAKIDRIEEGLFVFYDMSFLMLGEWHMKLSLLGEGQQVMSELNVPVSVKKDVLSLDWSLF